MRDNGGEAGSLGHLDRFQGLGQRTDLVELDQDGVTDLLVDTALEDLGVGYEQVVTDQLYLFADLVGQDFPASPVGLVHAVFDGDDRVALGQASQVVSKTGRIEYLAFASQIVVAVFVELAGSAVQCQSNVITQGIASIGNGFGDGSQRIFVGRQVRRKATFITHGSVQAARLQNRLEVVENFSAHAQCIGEVLGANRLNHELLNVDVVVGVLTTVDDVHHRHRHGVDAGGAVQVGDVRVQRHALGLCSSLGSSQGNSQDGVGAQSSLVLGAVQLDHRAVQLGLSGRITANQQLADGAIDIGNSLEHALAQITALVAITQFQRFARTGGGAGGCASAAHDAAFQNHVRFNGGVTARVQNLTALDINDFCHLYLLAPYIGSIG